MASATRTNPCEDVMKKVTVSIIPPEPADSGLTKAQGTRVVTSDGQELKGVFGITLKAESNGVWEAHLLIRPEMVELNSILATWEPSPRESGDDEVTVLTDDAVVHRTQ